MLLPSTVTAVGGVRNTHVPSDGRLTWPGASKGFICRYASPLPGDAPNPGSIYRAVRLSGSQATRLSYVVSRINTSIKPQAEPSCPADDGSATVIVLSYRHEPSIELWYDDGGCPILTNGSITGQAIDNPSFAPLPRLINDLAAPMSTGIGQPTTENP